MLEQEINKIKADALNEIKKTQNNSGLFNFEKKYLGKKSRLNEILKSLKNLTSEEKQQIGPLANKVKSEILQAIKNRWKENYQDSNWKKEKIDVTIPGNKKAVGHLNPISTVQAEIEDVFRRMGYEITDGPEIETEFYNFDSLNMPKDHPARDMQDTFWLCQKVKSQIPNPKSQTKDEKLVLRTHTSNVQVRYMEKHKPPFRIIVPGRVFRKEATDAKHEHTFSQFETLVVGEKVSVANFKHTAKIFFEAFFERELDIRLRPSFFPFTEPSFEFDISCAICQGKGCSTCGHSGWLEIGGAGMVNQKVFEAAGYPKNKYQGFAWGFGINRLAMLKYKINDIRLFNSGDLRFVRQF